jgi:Phage capsid family
MGVYRHKDFSVKPKEVIQQRLDEISNDLRRLCNQPTESLSEKQVAHIRRLTDEGLDLEGQLALHKKATSMASYASPSEWGMAGTNPGDDSGIAFKGFGPGMENRIRPTSMYEIDKSQINALRQAARQGTPFKVQVGSKGIEHGFMGGVRDKSAVTEGGLTPNLLPPIQQYGAGRILLTHELVQDAGDAFAQNLVSDLARSLYNATSALLLNGTTAGNGWPGINQVTGTLTRAAAIGSGDIDALDTLSKAFVDLRSDFFVPDLCFVHPSTMGALRRLRDLNNRLQLELLSGAGAINGTSEQETLWGVPVVQTTQQAAGTAAVLSVQSGAAVVYVREALTVFYDPYSMASSNVYQHIAEQRLALATPRPGAINLVSGLPTS